MEWLSVNELEQSCDAFLSNTGETDGKLCLAYMQGFLAGSDTAVASPFDKSAHASTGDSESFSERAARTRLGTLRLMQLRAAGRRDYCISEDTTAVEIVEAIVTYLSDHLETLQLTNAEAVRKALVHHYPCED